MKNLISSISILFSLMLLLSMSCTQKREAQENNIEFDSININKTYHLENDSTQPSCNLKINFIYPKSLGNQENLKKLQETFLTCFLDEYYKNMTPQEALEEYSQNYIRNYQEDVRIFFKDKEHDTSEDSETDNYLSYYETLSNRIKFNKANILSFQVERTNYKGGTNSYRQYANYVIDLKNNKLITEEDIFDPGYEKALNLVFKDKLKDANNVKDIIELEDLGYFGIEEIMPNSNFLIDDKGITYTFVKGEYSVLQLDEINIFVPYGEIKSLLKTDSPISVLLSK